MEHNKSSSELEDNINSIKKSKHNLVIGSIIVLVLILTMLVILLFNFKKENLGIKKEKAKNNVISEMTEQKDSSIKKFSDYNELKDFLESNSNNVAGEPMYGNAIDSDEIDMVLEEGGMARKSNIVEIETTQMPTTAEDKKKYSETNIQVEGVDEADIIKTDGNYIYTVSKKNLFIVDSKDPKNLNILSKIEFEDQPQDIYLNNDRLIVFGRNNEIRKKEKYSNFKRHSQYTFFKVFDISDRQNPKQLKNYDFEGNYSNSRMIGDHVYFLTNTSSVNYSDPFPVPRVLDNNTEIYNYSKEKQSCSGGCPDVYYIDDISSRYTMVNVMAINVQDVSVENNDSLSHEVYLMPHNQNLYVSQDNLYLTYTKYLNQQDFLTNLKLEIVWNKLSASEQNKINKIKNAEYFIFKQR